MTAEAVTVADVDDMLLREFAQASFNNLKAEMSRLAPRALDKVLAEFQLLGFAGFMVREVNGQLLVEGLAANEISRDVPDFLREVGAL